MASNLALKEELVEETLKLSGAKSKKDAINLAMEEFIKLKKRQRLMKLKGGIAFDVKYDYKASRKR